MLFMLKSFGKRPMDIHAGEVTAREEPQAVGAAPHIRDSITFGDNHSFDGEEREGDKYRIQAKKETKIENKAKIRVSGLEFRV